MKTIKDITSLMLQYRECCLSVWNGFLRHLQSPENYWDKLDAFHDIAVQLFSVFILPDSDGIKKSPSYYGKLEVLNNIRVRLNAPNTPIAISRDLCNWDYPIRNSYWDYPVRSLSDEQVSLRFMDFFDFDRQGIMKLEYYRVRIVDSIYPELIGHDALLKVEDCTVEIDQSEDN